MMVTNPNTRRRVRSRTSSKIAGILHAKGALVYMDGANMNALVGIARPGDFGIDVMHLNLHKTFSTPHGGGGPGAGAGGGEAAPGAVPARAAAEAARTAQWTWDYDRPQSIGRVRAFYGNFGVLVRALAYIHGARRRRACADATIDAVLNANYIRKRLEEHYDLPYDAPSMHECVFSDDRAGEAGRPHRRHRQAPDRLRLPSLHGQLPADRARRADDRADRDRAQARTRPVQSTRMIAIAKEIEERSARWSRRAAPDAHAACGRSHRGPQAGCPLEAGAGEQQSRRLITLAVCRAPFSSWSPWLP